MSAEKKKESLASLVIVLAVICLVMATLLGLVNSITEGPIAANNEKTVQDSLQVVLPADAYEEVPYDGTETSVIAVYKAGDEGYVVEVLSPNGFGGGIDMMTGVDNDGNVTGIAVISHAETSGLGSKATDPEWQAQFAGKNGSVTVEKDGGEIVAITGSTITSRAICDGVNTAFTVVGSLG
jgi:electron transport complex protein RnfG